MSSVFVYPQGPRFLHRLLEGEKHPDALVAYMVLAMPRPQRLYSKLLQPHTLVSRQFPVHVPTPLFPLSFPSVQSKRLKPLLTNCLLVCSQPGLARGSQDKTSRTMLLYVGAL